MLEMETNKDHVHMLLEADSRKDLSAIVRTIKAVSAKKILEGTPHLPSFAKLLLRLATERQACGEC